MTLRRGAQALECHCEIRNNIEDHRLRLLFPSDATEAHRWLAHHPYDLVERPIRLRRETADWSEADLAEKPFLNLQAVGDGRRGLALIVPGGMHEGGVVDDDRRTLQMTLFRPIAAPSVRRWVAMAWSSAPCMLILPSCPTAANCR